MFWAYLHSRVCLQEEEAATQEKTCKRLRGKGCTEPLTDTHVLSSRCSRLTLTLVHQWQATDDFVVTDKGLPSHSSTLQLEACRMKGRGRTEAEQGTERQEQSARHQWSSNTVTSWAFRKDKSAQYSGTWCKLATKLFSPETLLQTQKVF